MLVLATGGLSDLFINEVSEDIIVNKDLTITGLFLPMKKEILNESQIKNITDKDKIYFLPLGGTGEIGMNFNMYCYQNEWLIVDCGVTFKDAIAIGSDVFMPSIEAISKYNFKIKGMLITHAHEDHRSSSSFVAISKMSNLFNSVFSLFIKTKTY